MKLLSRSAISCLVCLAALGSSGCSGKGLHAVSGVVTMDGEPYADANVLFTPVGEGLSATGETDSGGNFKMHTRGTENGVMPGKYKVTITAIDRDYVRQGHPSEAFTKRAQEGKEVKGGGGAEYKKMQAEVTKEVKQRAKQRPVPLQYTDPTKTPFTVQVPDQSDVKFEMTSK